MIIMVLTVCEAKVAFLLDLQLRTFLSNSFKVVVLCQEAPFNLYPEMAAVSSTSQAVARISGWVALLKGLPWEVVALQSEDVCDIQMKKEQHHNHQKTKVSARKFSRTLCMFWGRSDHCHSCP